MHVKCQRKLGCTLYFSRIVLIQYYKKYKRINGVNRIDSVKILYIEKGYRLHRVKEYIGTDINRKGMIGKGYQWELITV